MILGKEIVDRGLLDRNGRHAGNVDDLILELPDPPRDQGAGCEGPEVVALLSGPMALSQNLSRPVQWFVRAIYRLMGIQHPRPSEVPWERVDSFDVVVHLSCDREDTGWSLVGDAVNRRFITKLPGA